MKKYKLFVFIVCCLFLFTRIDFRESKAELIFFSVGQGDAALLISPQGKTLLIDGGVDKTVTEKLGRSLKQRQKSIDWIVLTHAHEDHYIGLLASSEYYYFSNVIGPSWTDSQLILNWFSDLEENNSNIIELNDKMRRIYLEEDCFFDVLASPLHFNSKIEKVSENDLSYSVKINCYGIEALFTGDLERDGEDILLKKVSESFLSSLIFQAGHHGSKTSNSINFLEAVGPNLVIISAGEDNSHGHPHQETLNNIKKVNAKVLQTHLNGDIKILSNNKEISIETGF